MQSRLTRLAERGIQTLASSPKSKARLRFVLNDADLYAIRLH